MQAENTPQFTNGERICICAELCGGCFPWKKSKGRAAFHRVMVFIGVPEEYSSKKSMTKVPGADAAKLASSSYMTLEDLSNGDLEVNQKMSETLKNRLEKVEKPTEPKKQEKAEKKRTHPRDR